jgi:hypothetical protein
MDVSSFLYASKNTFLMGMLFHACNFREAEIGRVKFQGQPEQKVSPSSTNKLCMVAVIPTIGRCNLVDCCPSGPGEKTRTYSKNN